MNRSESDLRDLFADLEREADRVGAPRSADLLAGSQKSTRPATVRVLRRHWLPPLAAAALVAATAVVVTVSVNGSSDNAVPAGPDATTVPGSTTRPVPMRSEVPSSVAAAVLDDAATTLEGVSWTPPRAKEFFYVRTTDATVWASVSGRKSGRGRASDGTPISVPGCVDGRFSSGSGQEGACTLDDVQHYRADAPVSPGAWEHYLDNLAPDAKAAGAQGKIIVGVLHHDLLSPRATAGLLRFTKSCKGLHTVDVDPVRGRNLVGVTCTSMTAGSYGLAFDANTHAFVGYVVVDPQGKQDDAAEVILKTAIVSRAGEKP